MPIFSNIVGDWRELELFIKGIYQDVEEIHASHDLTITDADGAPRQIDVLLDFKKGPHNYKTIVECKHWKSNVERQNIDVLIMTVQKTRASKGVFFTTRGYQSGALTTAKANGIDAFLVRDPHDGEWWPTSAQDTHLQLCTYCPEDKIIVPADAYGVCAADPWPRGIKTSPEVRFGHDRTQTPILNREDRKSLEDLVDEAVRKNLEHVVAPLKVIGGGDDCVGHFTFRCDLKFVNPIEIQERTTPPVVICISRLSVNVAVRIEQRRFRRLSPRELGSCVIVEDCISNRKFQVSQPTPGATFVWMDMLQPPLKDQLPANSRLVVVSQEPFRAECFKAPWSTFGQIVIYKPETVPHSNSLTKTLQALAGY
ncbi:restriction endonuclease [Corallococcus sp. CA054B]|uniref:restriction endonuclease n=1 Tax=Corallococcus sp. CA054B TaxID=2316734 RepID=UPI0013157673|nr:restriction endonuclease [Corallococcus sp. CA054B]